MKPAITVALLAVGACAIACLWPSDARPSTPWPMRSAAVRPAHQIEQPQLADTNSRPDGNECAEHLPTAPPPQVALADGDSGEAAETDIVEAGEDIVPDLDLLATPESWELWRGLPEHEKLLVLEGPWEVYSYFYYYVVSTYSDEPRPEPSAAICVMYLRALRGRSIDSDNGLRHYTCGMEKLRAVTERLESGDALLDEEIWQQALWWREHGRERYQVKSKHTSGWNSVTCGRELLERYTEKVAMAIVSDRARFMWWIERLRDDERRLLNLVRNANPAVLPEGATCIPGWDVLIWNPEPEQTATCDACMQLIATTSDVTVSVLGFDPTGLETAVIMRSQPVVFAGITPLRLDTPAVCRASWDAAMVSRGLAEADVGDSLVEFLWYADRVIFWLRTAGARGVFSALLALGLISQDEYAGFVDAPPLDLRAEFRP